MSEVSLKEKGKTAENKAESVVAGTKDSSLESNKNAQKNIDILAENTAKIATKWHEVMEEYAKHFSQEEPGKQIIATQSNAVEAFTELMLNLMLNPEKLVEASLSYYNDYLKLLSDTNARISGEKIEPAHSTDKKDRRFKDVAWNENVLFDFLKRSYLLTCGWMQRTIKNVEFKDKKTAQKVDFYTRQFLEAISPSNFFLTNPEILRETVVTHGTNLVKGMENLVNDLKNSGSYLNIKISDDKAFEVGKNLAITKGRVIFQNDLMQLIQYNATTASVFKTPVLVVPAWINKYYILDLQPENSMVKWLVDQGHTVFMISWVNPDETMARKTFEDYMFEGPLDAMNVIHKATGEKEINVISYCLGGTLMASTLAYLKAKKEKTPSAKLPQAKSITYLTTLVDFSEPGDLGVFVDDWQLEELEEQLNKKGYFDGQDMALVFSVLRSRDLIWTFVVNNYMLGKEPFPFDILYWNADSTRLPAKMHIYYLRNMYRDNMLVKPNALTLGGQSIDLSKIDTPSYILSTIEDHIAPWKSTFAATKIYKGPIRFVLAGSGHVAGVVNPPSSKKYNHLVNVAEEVTADEWLEGATEYQGSWWEDWQGWMEYNKFSDERVPARVPGIGPSGQKLRTLEDAPGSYVKVKTAVKQTA